jgi:hypothetical protein
MSEYRDGHWGRALSYGGGSGKGPRMRKPSFEQITLPILVIAGSLGFYGLSCARAPARERYIDYCGHSVYKRPGAVQQEGITPLMLPDEDVPKYQNQASWIRPATVEELQILLRKYERRKMLTDHKLWTVTADAPPIVHTWRVSINASSKGCWTPVIDRTGSNT